MKSQYLSLPLLLLSATLALTSVPVAQAQTANSAAAAPDTARVIVRFKPEAASVRAKIMAARMSRSSAMDVAQTRATGLGMRTGLHASGGLRARLSLDERTHVFTASGIDSASLAKRLSQDSEIEMVAVDQRRRHFAVTPNDSLYGGATSAAPVFIGQFPDSQGKLQATYSRTLDQWYLKAPAGEVVSSINAPAAWDLGTGSSSVVVAVLDTGVRMDHPDLAGQFIGGYDMVGFSTSAGVATANDGNGADADASDPGDWVSQADIDGGTLGSGCTSADLTNSSWHGTRVSGLIAAASNNGQGIAGVAWGVKILPIRVLGKCGGYDSDIMAGMKWAAGISVPGLPTNPNPAKVLNLSLGGTGSCGTTGTGALYRDTITQVNATKAIVVVAAGNSEGLAVGLPGNCPGVISVAALRHVGSKVGFSSLGPEVAIAAPGGNCINLATGYPCLYPMLSTSNSGTRGPVLADAAYTNNSASVGTSFSAPIVAGTVALMASQRPSLTSTEVLSLLKSTARPFVSTGATAGIAQCKAPTSTVQDECYCTTSTCGAGMLDAAAAVAAAKSLNGASVAIAVTPSSAVAGELITLSAAGSALGAGRSVVSYAWTLVDGGGVVSGFSSASNGVSTTMTASAAGTVSVKVEVTDDLGIKYSATSSVNVAAAPVTTPPATQSSSSGGGGGGAFSALWVALLGLATWVLRRPQPQPLRA
ncbi:S8 family serine peptidase [Paucibacter sp. Y2R2-4]|uniref:S8 family serine peptidase n=1 Tax=Paucibacter sp. Y2R2-4 TaxID=2893553 RepID=UPI0021E51219|nr:S8 family serine peptidase [Paucibacter sp. Y2R2-4]MCV2351266.1 S8 family serine peptidase [Paucibacter sp. Y2R2-4]